MSGHPGASAPVPVAVASVTVLAPAGPLSLEATPVRVQRSKPSSATLPCALAGQWTETGMNGPAGAPALPVAPKAASNGPGSAMVLPMGVPSARGTGWRLETASCSNAQWMANGRPGRHGAAAVSRVEVEASDGNVFALDLSLGEQPARGPRMSTDSVALSDVPSPMRFVMRTTLGPWSGRRPRLERWLQSGVPAMPQASSCAAVSWTRRASPSGSHPPISAVSPLTTGTSR